MNYRAFLLALMLPICIAAHAQDWPYEDSRWSYDMQSVGMWGQYEMIVGTDTVVDGYTGKNILCNQVRTWVSGPGGETYTSQSGYDPFGVVFEVGDSVLYLDQPFVGDTVVRLLYDFSASAGDSWLLTVDDSSPCADSTYLNVTSSGVVEVDGEERRYIDVTTGYDTDVLLVGRAIERIGLVSGAGFGFFPGNQSGNGCLIYDGDVTTFTCYWDDTMGGYPDSETACTFLSVSEIDPNSWRVYPNPAFDVLTVEVLRNTQIEKLTILDVTGKRIAEFPFEERIDISTIQAGIYLLRIMTSDGNSKVQTLIIE